MICPRCGTEHENQDHICPRCGYGRPKPKKNLPRWLPWALGGVGFFAVVGIVIGAIAASYFSSAWMDGSWEGSNLAISFNADESSFLLSNSGTVISGTFTADKDAFYLTAEDGNLYVYRYDRINQNKIKLLFTRENETVRVTLSRVVTEVEELEEEDEEDAHLEDLE